MKKNKYKKIILITVTFFIVLATCFYVRPTDIATDSGFDTSYGSSGGSYSGGSSRHNSHSSGNWNGVSDMTTLDTHVIIFSVLAIVLPVLSVVVIWIISIPKYSLDENDVYTLNKKKAITDDKFKEYIKDESMEDFLLNRYQDYLTIQYAWMEFKYDILSAKTTNELYNQYVMQLETLKTKNQKNIMKEFLYLDSMITNITNNDNETAVTLELITIFYDYIEVVLV